MEVDFNAAQTKYKKLMEERDLVSPSPSERAQFVFEILQVAPNKPVLWDIVCFACEYLAVASEDIEIIQPAIKQLISQIYTAHYNVPDAFGTGITRESKHGDGSVGGSSKPTSIRPRLTVEDGGAGKQAKPELVTDNGNDSKGDRETKE